MYSSSVRRLVAVLVFALTLGFSSQAFAASALFDGTTQKLGFPYAGLHTQMGAVATLQGVTPKPGFKIPSWGTQGFSFTYSGGVYVNFNVYRTEMVQAGDFTKSFFPPSASFTIMHNELSYPARATTPGPGHINMKIGPAGFGGVQTHTMHTIYIGTVAASPGFSNHYLDLFQKFNSASLDAGPYANGGGQRTNWTTLGIGGEIWEGDPQRNHMTGTITEFEKFATPFTITAMGADTRNDAGTLGQIQMIAPSFSYNYFIPGNPWDDSGTHPIGNMLSENWQYQTTNLTFVPEPSQLLMLGFGGIGLLGMHLRRKKIR